MEHRLKERIPSRSHHGNGYHTKNYQEKEDEKALKELDNNMNLVLGKDGTLESATQ